MVILLTACVNPQGMAFTRLQDSNIRLNQYKAAINFYLNNTDKQIIVAENTGYDFTNDFKEYVENNRLECLTFDGNNYNKILGKGYGEALIINYVLNNSRLIEKNDLIIKITGRYIVSNIVQILSYIRNENYIYVNISKINGRFLCDSRLFVSPISALKEYFLPNKEMINDSLRCYFEHILYYSISLWQNNGGKVKEFRCPINFIGVTGSTGKMLSKHPQSCLKALLRFYLHKLGIFRNRKE